MLFKKQGSPQENELVLCKVTKILHNCVLLELTEYGLEGILHISEISPGRIRNIRDYVKVGKVIVCKVLRFNKKRGYLDVSLRRVNEGQKRQKVNEAKQEQMAEKIVEFVAKNHKLEVKDLYREIVKVVMKEYETLYSFFEEVVAGNDDVQRLGLKEDVAKTLEETIYQRIKVQEYEINGEMRLTSYAEDGVDVLRKTLNKYAKKGVEIHYAGGGRYNLRTKDADVKEAKKRMYEAKDGILKVITRNGDGEFEELEDRK